MMGPPPGSVSPAAISSLWASVGVVEVPRAGATARLLVVREVWGVDLAAVKNSVPAKVHSYLCLQAEGGTQNHPRPAPDSTIWEAAAGQVEGQCRWLDMWTLTHSIQDQIGRRLGEGEVEG